MMSPAFDQLLSKLDRRPVLIDIGAAVAPPEIWQPIASHSVYVGFDPDPREMQPPMNHPYYKAVIVNEAVTHDAGRSEAHFYFTKSPTCSSTLKPDAASLGEYLFADLFVVERETDVRATTLDAVIDRLALPGVDWLKTDSQGTDLRLFESLKPDRRARVLALDLEPGLIDAYVGEDLFVDAHKQLLRSGFWLSNLEVQGTVKMRNSTLSRLKSMDPDPVLDKAANSIKISPGWVNARYLRTLPWLARGGFGKRDYVVLWVFAWLDAQVGFACDLAVDYEQRFGQDDTSRLMLAEALVELRKLGHRRRSIFEKAKSFFSAR
jgi:methyltransferase FkbM-like protein